MIRTKAITALLALVSAMALNGCQSNTLKGEEVERLLREAKAYPKVVDYNVFCGDDVTVRKVLANGLEKDGYVTAQLAHTATDLGQPLVRFTEKSKPYFLPTSDTAKSINVQKVKLADEQLTEINEITINAQGTRALVRYTVTLENLTPFVAMLEPAPSVTQTRETYFNKTEKGWQWEGKIVKTTGVRN